MMKTKPNAAHERLSEVQACDGELVIGGIPLRQLAARVGATPFYAYDRAQITARVAQLRRHLPGEVKLHYAIKANPMPAVVSHLARLVDGFDVASHQELLVALDTGMSPAEISFAGPGKRPPELVAAIAAGICLNVESELELERIAASAKTLGLPARVALRVNPDFELKGSGMKMGGSARQFGIDAERIPAAIAAAINAGLSLEGLHIYCGSQNLNAQSLIDANQQTLRLAAEFMAHTPNGFRFINIGGGYGIPYFPGDISLDLAAVGQALGETINCHRPQLGNTQIVVELGRYLVGEAGYYVAEITDIKISKGQRFLIVNGGLHHHLANSGNFGQVLRKNYPVVIGTKLDDALPRERASVVGPLCTPLDIVCEGMELPVAEVGDLVVVLQSGAYGLSASPIGFLSQPVASEVLV